jgi:hypothetical protein
VRLAIVVPFFAALTACRSEVSRAPASHSTCEGCHAREAAEWSASLHRASFTSPDFQRSYRSESLPYCIECHAPLPDRTAGIGCISCHVEPHAGRTKPCAACHDFDVPGSRAVLQSTEREHVAGAHAKTACETCHMGPKRDHRFSLSRDTLRQSIHVHSASFERDAVRVEIGSSGVGHRFPTGDVYRRLTLTLTAYRADGALVGGETFYANRDWDEHRASIRERRAESFEGDTRLGDVPRTYRFACPTRPARVHLTVTYARGASAEGTFFEAFDSFEIFDEDLAIR